MKISPIEIDMVRPWLIKKHYAHRVPPIKYAFGLIDNELVIGIVTFGPPASPQVAKSVAGEANRLIVLELNRLCLDTEITNAASMLVGAGLRLLPGGKIVVSYADGQMGHIGFIYQATNFHYCGAATAHDSEYIVDGKKVHPRTLASRGITNPKEWAAQNGIESVAPCPKHRYVFFTGSRSDKKKSRKLLLWKIESQYPKGGAKRYDAGNPLDRSETQIIEHPELF